MALLLDKKNLERLSQADLELAIKKHGMYGQAKVGGARALLTHKDISGLEFRGADLSGADFSGSLMFDADMRNCKLEGSVFFTTNLQKAHLNDAKLNRVDMRGANIQGADFSGADMTFSDLREGSIARKDRRGNINLMLQAGAADTFSEYVDAREALFLGTKMNRIMLRGANMEGAILENADLSGAQMQGASLKKAILLNIKMDSVEVSEINFEGALKDEIHGLGIEDADEPLSRLMNKHATWVESHGKDGTRLDLTRYDLRAHRGQQLDFKEQHLTMMKARQTIFYHIRFSGAEIQACDFRDCDFRLCYFDRADLRGSDFAGSNMMRATFQLARFHPLKLPNGRSLPTDLSGCNLRYADFTAADLRGVKLAGADLSFADLRGANLESADMAGAVVENALF